MFFYVRQEKNSDYSNNSLNLLAGRGNWKKKYILCTVVSTSRLKKALGSTKFSSSILLVQNHERQLVATARWPVDGVLLPLTGMEPKTSCEADEGRHTDDLAVTDTVRSLNFCPSMPLTAAVPLIYSSRAVSVVAAYPFIPHFLLCCASVGESPMNSTDRQQDFTNDSWLKKWCKWNKPTILENRARVPAEAEIIQPPTNQRPAEASEVEPSGCVRLRCAVSAKTLKKAANIPWFTADIFFWSLELGHYLFNINTFKRATFSLLNLCKPV